MKLSKQKSEKCPLQLQESLNAALSENVDMFTDNFGDHFVGIRVEARCCCPRYMRLKEGIPKEYILVIEAQ